jgi:pilus assembly protein CpaF
VRPTSAAPANVANAPNNSEMASLAARFHARILDQLDFAQVAKLSPDELRVRLRAIVEQLVAVDRVALSEEERDGIVERVLDELTGLGPLEALLKDPTVTDILVNGPERVFVERHGRMTQVAARFHDDRHLVHTIQRIVARMGRRIDESSPMVDARLPDGSRVNAVIPPVTVDGASLSIRRFSKAPFQASLLVERGMMSAEVLQYLSDAVRGRKTLLICGGTGAGKTTLLNALSSFIGVEERIVTVEDAAELKLSQPNVVRLEARPPNIEGRGEISIRDLVRNALRMRPDRIVVGECRGGEVLDMLQAMNTGHEGSLSTVHANNTRDAIARLTTMLGMAGTVFSEDTIRSLIARAIQVVVHVARMPDGNRRVTGVAEVLGYGANGIEINDLFAFEKTGISADGRILGEHRQLNASRLADSASEIDLAWGDL